MICKELLLYLSLIPLCDFALMKVQSLPVVSSPSPTTARSGNIFPQECGLRKIKNASRGGRLKRIVGGSQSTQGKWPWQAALLFKGIHYCGGAIISNTWIVTTSHCFNPLTSHRPEDWTVILGEHHLNKKEEAFEQRRRVVNITTHEDYISMWFEGIYDTPPKNDVALLKLSKPLVFNNYVQPLCLPRPNDKFIPNEECYVAGWGHTQWNGTQPDILREAKVKLVSREVCNQEKSYNGTIHDTAFCAGFPSGGIDACEYDSGGALVCTRCGRFYAAGLVSWGDECARPHKYGVYADLTALTPWIIQKIRQFEIDATSLTSALRG